MVTTTATEGLSLKASLFPLTILPIKDNNLAALAQALDAKIKQAPSFFSGIPVVLDLHTYSLPTHPPFDEIKSLLDIRGLKLIGVATNNELYKTAANAYGLALMAPKSSTSAKKAPEQLSASPTAPALSKVVTQTVRSGQQIYADHDLIVLGTVRPGAEIIAGGHIHVYGKLSGRALAGIHQQTDARIFCREFDAELIAIAGVYQVKEDFDAKQFSGSMVQIYLDKNHLKIDTI